MFLDVLLRRNPAFVSAAIALQQEGAVPAAAYVLDLDAVEHNAGLIAAEAARLHLDVYAMTKQVGRHPAFMAAVRRGGIDAGVAVDMECTRALRDAGMRLGHVGHLVQVPRHGAAEATAAAPDNWTVFDRTKAAEAAAAAEAAGREQSLLARLVAPGDTFYNGHEGGFAADDAVEVAEAMDGLPGARFGGITTFPALLYDHDRRTVAPTPNLGTLERAAARLRAAGRSDVRLNAPGTTSSGSLGILAAAGATQVEPGHGLTGTTPLHAVHDEPELPAALYIAEISHHHAGRAYCYGGGFYVDPVFPPYPVQALVARDGDLASAVRVGADLPPPAMIDYYGMLDPPAGVTLAAGSSAVFGFRIQAFFARAPVVAVRGVASGAPRVVAA
jgi:predicted amino acid racemase